MLKKIRLENFKNWQELDLELSDLTFLFGTNSSGKTSILSSLLLLKQTATGLSDKFINLGGRESDYVDFGGYKDLVFGHDEQQAVGIRLDWMSKNGNRNYSIGQNSETIIEVHELAYTIRWKQLGGRIVVDHFGYEVLEPKEPKRTLNADRELRAFDPSNKGLYRVSPGASLFSNRYSTLFPLENYYTIEPSFIPGDFEPFVFSRSFEVFMKQIAYLGPLRSFPARNYLWKGSPPQQISPRGEGAIELLIASARDPSSQELLTEVARWLGKMGLVDSFQIKPLDPEKRVYEALVKVSPHQPENSLMDVGFGISQVLPVIVLLFSVPPESIVLIEQPELHLHPSAQAGLADLFLYAAEKHNLQLIIESHSEHLLGRLQRRIAERDNELASPEHVKMYFCDAGPNGSTIETVKVDQYGQIANWPGNFFGDIDGDLEKMTRAALEHRRQELKANE